MKVAFPLIKTRPGGVDVYLEKLTIGLKKHEINFNVNYYPHKLELFPILLKYIQNDSFDEFDIIHTNLENGYIFKNESKPLVVTSHHLVFDSIYQKYTNWGQKLYHHTVLKSSIKTSLKCTDYIITVSKFTKSQLIKEFNIKNPIAVVYNGIDTDKFKPMNLKKYKDKIRLLFVGNMIKRKGFDLLPIIMNRLGKHFELTIVSGLDSNKKISQFETQNITIKQGLSTEQLIREYNQCDIFLFPSRLEGFGYTVAEAMACAKPCVVTNCSSLPELIDDKKGGFLCSINDIGEFVEKIRILANDGSLRETMGQYNRNKVLQKFSIDTFIRGHVNVYNEVLKEK